MLTYSDYYPFGMAMHGRTYNFGDYRYGFNGKEKDDELKGLGNSYDYGARLYDPRIGRWMAVDPLAKKYPFASPYNFALNTPVQAYDPDGRLVIFVNGFRFDDYVAWIERQGARKGNVRNYLDEAVRDFFTGNDWITDARINDHKPWENYPDHINYDKNNYWGEIDNMFYERFTGQIINEGSEQSYYVDGMHSPNSTAQDKYDKGVAKGEAIFKKIQSGDIQLKVGETIKLVGHSHGGWESRGIADYLASQNLPVEALYMVNPHQPIEDVNRLKGVPGYLSIQYSRKSDILSSTDTSGKALSKILRAFGQSRYGQMQGVTENKRMKDLPDKSLGGHGIENASEVFDILRLREGYVRKNGEK